jgi:hypothetical protein
MTTTASATLVADAKAGSEGPSPLGTRSGSVYAVLLSSVGRQRLCTPLRSLLARGDE